MSLITDFSTLRKGTPYIYMLTDDSEFSINKSFNSLSIGTFDGIDKRDKRFFLKFFVINATTWDGRRVSSFEYPTTPDDIRVFEIPQNDQDYTDFVNMIERYGTGKRLDQKSQDIINMLKVGPSSVNVNNLHYSQQAIEAPPAIEAPQTIGIKRNISDVTQTVDNNKDDECPICLEPLGETKNWITTNCGHKFHRLCISRTINPNKCAICRQQTKPYKINSPTGGRKTKRRKYNKSKKLKKRRTTNKQKIKKGSKISVRHL
jgi:hypothetical protein